jgi:hypothetical protein
MICYYLAASDGTHRLESLLLTQMKVNRELQNRLAKIDSTSGGAAGGGCSPTATTIKRKLDHDDYVDSCHSSLKKFKFN